MPFKKSATEIQRNKQKWRKNLVQFQSQTRRGHVPLEEKSLSEKSRMPKKKVIVGRYNYLARNTKGRKARIALIVQEVKALWQDKLNFPIISDSGIRLKLEKLLKQSDNCVRKQTFEPMEQLFDITKASGDWLCAKDKELYLLQRQSNGEVGYSTGKEDSKSSIHPSKRRKLTTKENASEIPDQAAASDTDQLEDSDQETTWQPSGSSESTKRKYHKTAIASRLVTGSGLSTSKASKVCRQLSGEGIELPTPTQPAVHKALFRRAKEVKENYINSPTLCLTKNGAFTSTENTLTISNIKQ